MLTCDGSIHIDDRIAVIQRDAARIGIDRLLVIVRPEGSVATLAMLFGHPQSFLLLVGGIGGRNWLG